MNIVSDVSGNRNDKIANAAGFLKRSEDRKKIFKAIYSGKKNKKVSEIQRISGLSNKIRVLQECQKLYAEDIIDKADRKLDNELVYIKKQFYNQNRNKILSLSKSPERLTKFPTKINPRNNRTSYIKLEFPKKLINVERITIDDIDSFSNICKLSKEVNSNIYEKEVKNALKFFLKEEGVFTDWGGETDDLYTTRLIFKKKRYSAAFGLKGRGTKGILTPKKMGKNGDQIQRLFKSPADFFIIQYVGQIDESIIYQMNQFAIAKSVSENRKVFFGVIDGKDTLRLMSSYK